MAPRVVAPLRLGHPAGSEVLQVMIRAAAAAAVGHLLGAVVGIIVLSGPAPRLPVSVGLFVVHLGADVGASLLAVQVTPGVAHRLRLTGTVVAVGAAASVLVLWLGSQHPGWLGVRAALVVGTVAVLLGRQAAPAGSTGR